MNGKSNANFYREQNGCNCSVAMVTGSLSPPEREDITPLCAGYAPENFAILRTIAVNLFRQHGFTSVTQGLRQLAHDVRRLFSFFQ
ncbi:MAG: hypothetical protein KME13_18105 [Myxacorys californica WJT36-NPBG1]|jgi:hypothetical protein|nr:hypothetical protein [Myxacorys californica WJT36-NPBG1]